MNERIEQIRQRRDLLVTRADLQRFDLELQVTPWKKPLRLLDHGIAYARRAREHPVVLALAVAVLVYAGRHRLRRVLGWGLSAWRVYRLLARPKKSRTTPE
jgi:hypothetical protein